MQEGGGKGPVISYARGGEGREGGIWLCHSDIYRNSPVVFYIQQLCVIVIVIDLKPTALLLA